MSPKHNLHLIKNITLSGGPSYFVNNLSICKPGLVYTLETDSFQLPLQAEATLISFFSQLQQCGHDINEGLVIVPIIIAVSKCQKWMMKSRFANICWTRSAALLILPNTDFQLLQDKPRHFGPVSRCSSKWTFSFDGYLFFVFVLGCFSAPTYTWQRHVGAFI